MANLPRTPRPHRPVGRRTIDWATRWLGKLGRADTALGPAELAAIYLIFFIVGWSVGGTFGEILRPSAKFLFRIGGAIVALILVKPVRSIRTRAGYLGIAGAVLLVILISVANGSVGRMVAMSKETVTAVRLEHGNTNVDPADICIKETSYQLGLLTREETDRLCGYKTKVQKSEKGEEIVRYREVPKPGFLSYVWELVKLSVVVGILVFIFKKP